jgi:hypothetical protein
MTEGKATGIKEMDNGLDHTGVFMRSHDFMHRLYQIIKGCVHDDVSIGPFQVRCARFWNVDHAMHTYISFLNSP